MTEHALNTSKAPVGDTGGVEFNWPQHHRPATFMPVEVQIEEHADGSRTLWCGDHDPMNRLKGMHGICLHPDKAYIEIKVRLYNRTPLTQTFLWWANVATRVHERYQSFFPPDVHYVADHAKRAMSRFPQSDGHYYGVNYGERVRNGVPDEESPPQFVSTGTYALNDLSWYANIPVPTSYMAIGSKEDFHGGYDHAREAGLVLVANHHIAPGKKQWTWGNHCFGYAWDRHLTDKDGPYIELMAGVYTDNQPDFAFLAPGETKTFSQFWYPILDIGPAQQANAQAALSLRVEERQARVGVCVTETFKAAKVHVRAKDRMLAEWVHDLSPHAALIESFALPPGLQADDLTVSVESVAGECLLRYTPPSPQKTALPPAATEPPAPEDIAGTDELYVTGLHLEQYRHATRYPEPYWHEALRRDPGDSRCNNALGLWHLRRGEFAVAENHFRLAIERLTLRNPNPRDGEAYYNLGLTLRYLGRDKEAYDAFYKAAWNQAWQAASYLALAELDVKQNRWKSAHAHLTQALRLNMDALDARNLQTIVLDKLGLTAEARKLLEETRALDRLDIGSRYLHDGVLPKDNQLLIDLALTYARWGLLEEAADILQALNRRTQDGSVPIAFYLLAHFFEQLGDAKKASATRREAGAAPMDYCFPNRLEEYLALQATLVANPDDGSAAYYLGNLLYDRRLHEEAIACWERATRSLPHFSIVWRNLGIGYFNVLADADKACIAFDAALRANSTDARLLYERDQLWKRIGRSPQERLEQLQSHQALTAQRDDLAIELATLYNQTNQPAQALALLQARHFQPWEGGEGLALGQYATARRKLGRSALAKGALDEALEHFEAALNPPDTLGEAAHLLANRSDLYFWLGKTHFAAGRRIAAEQCWGRAARSHGDFQEMSVQSFSEMTYYQAMAIKQLGRREQAESLLRALLEHAEALLRQKAKIDYFATSLPTMLLFDDDLQKRQTVKSLFLQAQAHHGLGNTREAEQFLNEILCQDRNHLLAAEWLTELELSRTLQRA